MGDLPTIILQPTTRIVDVSGVPARVWEGTTSNQEHVCALIAQVAVHPDADQQAFRSALKEARPPTAVAVSVFPLRMIV